MDAAELDEEYFTWLYSHIGAVKLKNRAMSYWGLARQLFTKEFVWLVPNDDNRAADGRDLRFEFINAYEISNPDPNWLDQGCSMFEMLLALARNLSFEADGEVKVWFWHLIEVLELKEFSDNNYDKAAQKKIDETLDRVIFRTYAPDGSGGLFPLQNPSQDQREVEIWYQLNAYLLELL